MAESDAAPTFASGEKTVAAAGTAEALRGTQRVRSVVVVAKSGNTGKVYLGGSDVASTTNDGMDPGDKAIIPASNWLDLADIYIDVDTSGEGVDYYAQKS